MPSQVVPNYAVSKRLTIRNCLIFALVFNCEVSYNESHLSVLKGTKDNIFLFLLTLLIKMIIFDDKYSPNVIEKHNFCDNILFMKNYFSNLFGKCSQKILFLSLKQEIKRTNNILIILT